MPMVKMVPRGFTAAADAYLTPHILRCAGAHTSAGAGLVGGHDVAPVKQAAGRGHVAHLAGGPQTCNMCLPPTTCACPLPPPARRYIEAFQAGFDAGLARVPVYFMQSDGGLTSVGDFSGHKAILSGPAGASGCNGATGDTVAVPAAGCSVVPWAGWLRRRPRHRGGCRLRHCPGTAAQLSTASACHLCRRLCGLRRDDALGRRRRQPAAYDWL